MILTTQEMATQMIESGLDKINDLALHEMHSQLLEEYKQLKNTEKNEYDLPITEKGWVLLMK
jgi:hypothetical protein